MTATIWWSVAFALRDEDPPRITRQRRPITRRTRRPLRALDQSSSSCGPWLPDGKDHNATTRLCALMIDGFMGRGAGGVRLIGRITTQRASPNKQAFALRGPLRALAWPTRRQDAWPAASLDVMCAMMDRCLAWLT